MRRKSKVDIAIYHRKNRWKWWLAITGLLITALSAGMSYYLAQQLQEEEQRKVNQWKMAYEQLNFGDPSTTCDITLLTQVLADNKTVPVILVNDKNTIDGANNFGESLDQDTVFLRRQLNHIKASGMLPIRIETGVNTVYIYYKHSNLLRQLQYFPFVLLLLVGGFVVVGYNLFSTARRAEQNLVWIGMAKETAHQLGTPITALMGWVEHLRYLLVDKEGADEIIKELDNDVVRLEIIADRFSKIGSTPELKPENIYWALDRSYQYLHKRLPRKVELLFPNKDAPAVEVKINPHLFDWVIENLIRNAIDATEGKGKITLTVSKEPGFVVIEVTDSGKGIPLHQHKRIFEPGFTTKTRGWGLGLSLAKRIVEQYHDGKIFVRRSIVGQGATFAIYLPQ